MKWHHAFTSSVALVLSPRKLVNRHTLMFRKEAYENTMTTSKFHINE